MISPTHWILGRIGDQDYMVFYGLGDIIVSAIRYMDYLKAKSNSKEETAQTHFGQMEIYKLGYIYFYDGQYVCAIGWSLSYLDYWYSSYKLRLDIGFAAYLLCFCLPSEQGCKYRAE